MRARTLQTWIARRIGVRRRLEKICTGYLLFLMVVTTKHSLAEAAQFSGLHKSQFSKMLKTHSHVAVSTLESLSKKQAKHVAKALHKCKGLPWKIVLNPTATSIFDLRAGTQYAPPAYPMDHQEAPYVTSLSDRRRRLCHSHV